MPSLNSSTLLTGGPTILVGLGLQGFPGRVTQMLTLS